MDTKKVKIAQKRLGPDFPIYVKTKIPIVEFVLWSAFTLFTMSNNSTLLQVPPNSQMNHSRVRTIYFSLGTWLRHQQLNFPVYIKENGQVGDLQQYLMVYFNDVLYLKYRKIRLPKIW